MFRKANIRLTLLYSILFLIAFWAFSTGLYIWMENSFGKDYISQIAQHELLEGDLNQRDTTIAAIAGDVTLHRLRDILLILNGGLLIVVPGVAWIVTRRTLAPVQRIHNQQRQFVADVAHELRTPLTVISGELEVALSKERTLADYQGVLASSKQETDRLIELAENLLFLARIDQGRQSVDFEKVDVTDLIGSVIASLQRASSHKKVDVHFQPGSEPIFAFGQATMLRRLFFNIVHNAVLYTPSGGNIWISLSTTKQYSQIEVKDDGIGISVENREKIFSRFFRVDDSRSQARGYGLGLAICKSIIELHHGSISVASGLGQGSAFTILLPSAKL
jgi:signal transduction histidine kinase